MNFVYQHGRPKMNVVKEVVTAHRPDAAPVCGFVSYISLDHNVLLRRMGWETGDDVHEDFCDQISEDNGRTWSTPRPSLSSRKVDGGYIYYIEFAALSHSRGKFIVVDNEVSQPALDSYDPLSQVRLHISVSDAGKELQCAAPVVSDFGMASPGVSFCNPVEDARGRVLLPISWQKRDEDGSLRALGIPMRPNLPDVAVDWGEMGLLIGEFDEASTLHWRIGGAVPMELNQSTRGLCEGALAELRDGKLALVMRGSNGPGPGGGPDWSDTPGYKWLSLSSDGGENWSPAAPLTCDDGTLIESGASGSILFRSIKNGKLYWMGNLCLDGARAAGNFPRDFLVLAEVQEEPFALKRSTFQIVDQRSEHEHPRLQLSNFKQYQDRETGELVFYLTRYGERGDFKGKWLLADQYQYRVSLD